MAILSPKDAVSCDKSVQATLRMWDDNVLTMLVDARIAGKLREGDMVLCDYRPEKGLAAPIPRNVVIKILRGKVAERMWHEYKEVHDKRRRHDSRESQAQQSYIG